MIKINEISNNSHIFYKFISTDLSYYRVPKNITFCLGLTLIRSERVSVSKDYVFTLRGRTGGLRLPYPELSGDPRDRLGLRSDSKAFSNNQYRSEDRLCLNRKKATPGSNEPFWIK